jgi:hypothetical protein
MLQFIKDIICRDWYHLSLPLKAGMVISIVSFYVALMGNISNIYKEPLHCMGSQDIMEHQAYFAAICKSGKLYTKQESYVPYSRKSETPRVSISYFEEQPMMAALIAASFCGFFIFSHYERGELASQTDFEALKLTETSKSMFVKQLRGYIMKSTLLHGHWTMELVTEIFSILLVGLQFYCLNIWMNGNFSNMGIMYLRQYNLIPFEENNGTPIDNILELLFPVRAYCDINDLSGPSGTLQNRTLQCAINSNALFGKFMLMIFFLDVLYIITTCVYVILRLFIFSNPLLLKCFPGIVFKHKNTHKVIGNLSGTQYYTYQLVMANIMMKSTSLAEDLENEMSSKWNQ